MATGNAEFGGGHDSNGNSALSAEPKGPLSGPIGMLLAVALFATAGYLTYRTFTHGEYEQPAEMRVWYICSETKRPFEETRKLGESYPVYSPFSKKNTGYPAERCYWTKDGKIKDDPTFVLLNEYIGKPGPTLCPDCGRVVTPHNPRPTAADAAGIVVPPVAAPSAAHTASKPAIP